jgi:MFS transporter, DHA2 family, multidrug resistance protein
VTAGESPATRPAGHVNPWLEAIAVLTGTFMVVLDTTVVNVSLPHIAGSLSATVEESTWALTSYLAANAVILPMTGWLATYFGRKRLLLLSIIGFTSASFLCGLAPNLSFLIVCRVIQGATGGVMQPLSQSIMLEAFPPAERGKAMGFWGIGIVVAPVLGPVLGGWLTDNYSWRWIFYINVPIGIAAVVLNTRYVFDPAYLKRQVSRVDYWGLSYLAIGIAALQITLDKGEQEDWFSSNLIVVLAIVAAAGLIALVVRELRVKDPIVDLRVFRERTYAAGAFLITLVGFVLFASLVLVPIMLQTLLRYPPLQAGIAMAPRGIGSLIAMPLVGIAMSWVDPRKLLAAGFLLGAWTMFALASFDMSVGYWDIFWPQFYQGVALGLMFVPLTTITMDRISREHMGNATSLFNLVRNIGGSAGIAIVETRLANARQFHTSVLAGHIDGYSLQNQLWLANLKAAFMARGADAATATERAYAAAWGLVQQQAAILSFLDMFAFLGVVFLVMTPLVLVMRRPTHAAEHPAAPVD